MRRFIYSVAGAVLLGAAAHAAAPPPGDFADKGEGKELVNDILTRVPAEPAEVLGLLKIRAPEGGITEVPIKMIVRPKNQSWEDAYETQPAGGRPGEVLVIRHHGTAPSEYLYGRFRKPGEKIELSPVSGESLYQPLAGSEFYLADLGLEFLHWPQQKIVKKEMRKSRSCRVVESTNPAPGGKGYSRVLSWIDFETSNLIMAEAYDAQGRKLKEFSIRKISRSEGKAQLKEIEMRNDQTDARTRLEFNLDLPEEAAPK